MGVPKMRLRTGLAISFLLAALVPTITFGLSAYQNGLAREHEEVKDRHLLLAQNVSAALERYHVDVSATFDALALSLEQGKSLTNMHSLMQRIHLNCVSLFNPLTGEITARTSVPDNPAKNLFSPELIQRLMAQTPENGVHFSPVVDGGAAGNLMFVTRRVGSRLAVGTLTTDYFVTLGSSISFGEKGHAAIIDQKGNLLAHPLPSWTESRKNIARVSAAKRMMAGETGIETFFSPALKGDMIAGLTQVKDAGWGVMIPQPVAELQQKVVRNNIAIIFGLAIGIFIAFGLTYLFVRSLATPLEGFLATMKRNARQGHLGESVVKNGLIPVHEVNHFAVHYNSLVRRV